MKVDFMMDTWLAALSQVVDGLLKQPDTTIEKMALIVGGVGAGLWVLAKGLNAFNCERPAGWRTALAFAWGAILILAAQTAIAVQVPAAPTWWPWAALVGVSVILVVPLISALHKVNLMGAFIAWALSVATLAGVILMMGAGFDAVASGSKDAGKAKAHKGEMEQLMGQ